jgi:hypothetical protein
MTHVLALFEEVLSTSSHEQTSKPPRGRPETLPVPHLLLVCVLSVLRKSFSPTSVWRTLLLETVGTFAPLVDLSRQAVRQRLLAVGLSPFSALLLRIQAILHQRGTRTTALSLASFAPMVVALDECKLSAVARLCDEVAHWPKDSQALLVGKLAALFDVRKQQWVQIQFLSDAFSQSVVPSLLIVELLPKASLILADLGYFGFGWFRALSDMGYHWVSRLKSSCSYQIVHTFYQQGETLDALVWLGIYNTHQYPSLVRLVQYRHGASLYRYITDITDPHLLPTADLVRLYARRWDIELAFKLVKASLGLRLWWTCQQTLVLQQLLLTLIVAQVIHFFQLEIAAEAGVDPFEVSLDILLKLLAQASWPCPFGLFAALVSHARRFGLIRPSRRTSFDLPFFPLELLEPAPPDLVWKRPWKLSVRKKPRHPRITDPFDFRFLPRLLL